MNCQEIRTRLDDFVDRALPHRQLQVVEEHLAECSACRRDVAELKTLLAEARRLAGVTPRRDLWPDIEARLQGLGRSRALLRFPRPRRPEVRHLLLAAAGVILIVLTIPLILARLEPPVESIADGAVRRGLESTAILAELARSEDGVLITHEDLLTALVTDGRSLPPETLVAVEASMHDLDVAIGEIRAALESSPDDQHLNLLLASRYHQEVDLLKQLKRI